MNPQGTSFIPKRPTQGKVKQRGVRKIYVLTYVSYVMFFGSVLAAAGTFFYSYALDKQLDRQRDLLVSERSRFSQSDMESIRELNTRVETAKTRMDKHISVPLIFAALEDSAAQSMQFSGFSYKRPNDGAPLITLQGTTDESFNSVLFQREVLLANPILAGATFTEVALANEQEEGAGGATVGVISFGIDKEIDPTLIQYSPVTGLGSAAFESELVEPEFIEAAGDPGFDEAAEDTGPGFDEISPSEL